MTHGMERFGKYLLLEQIAAGGMAEVFLSKSQGANGVSKFVAIKRILPQYSNHQEFVDMFKEEAKIAVNLNHSNVVSIHDFGVEKNQFYLVMEYVEGRNLRQILNELKPSNGNFGIEQATYVIKEVAAGLDYAHRSVDGATGKPLSIIHRDISPQNIMVSFEGAVKIIDFGIAKATTQLEATKTGVLKGKYGYMSPEQADGESFDHRTDIFSLGIVLWELLANERLFTGSNESAILRKIRECQIPSISKINPSVPLELENILNKALAKDQNFRYQNASALSRDLNRFLNTNYPEFSQNDFSIFIKNLFNSSFMETRKKLIEFSKKQIDDIIAPPSSNPLAKSQNLTPPKKIPKKSDAISDGDSIENLDVNKVLETPLNFGEIKVDKKPKFPTDPKQVGENTGLSLNPMMNTGIMRNHETSARSNYQNGTRANVKSKNFFSLLYYTYISPLVHLSVFLLVLLGGWWMYTEYVLHKSALKILMTSTGLKPESVTKYLPEEVQVTVAKHLPTAKEPPPQKSQAQSKTQQTDLATSAPEYILQISSNPTKSKVIIDGVDTGEYTPLRKTVKANVPINIRLTKEGYSDYVTTHTPNTDVGAIEGNLQRLVKTASIYIKLFNAGVNPELRIAGIPVEIKPNSDSYIIQAEVKVKIQATNKLTGLTAEKTVSIPADQKEIVELFLK